MDSSPHESVGHLAPPDQVTNLNAESQNTKATGQRHVALGLNRTYASHWKVPDALRELYQNWKDAIIQTHNISLFNFLPHISATPTDIKITVKANQRDKEGQLVEQVLGYILFNKVRGNAEFTNFNSTLDDRCLELGHSTKTEDHGLAGGHGEGLKIAALVLCRENHPMKIFTNGYRWHFAFNGQLKTNFYCRLTPAKTSVPSGARDRTDLIARIEEDVKVIIGEGQKGKNGQPLSLQDIETWMRDTIDLHPPSGRIRTRLGDLLLEPTYRGQLYLKGFRVPEPSLDSSAFRFGYNLTQGSVDRDRQRLVNLHQVTESIHMIWESAIAEAETVVLPRYLELLRDYPSSFDARDADRLVTENIARKMWDALVRESKMEDLFYCSESGQNKDSPMIRSELKKEPKPLPGLLWTVLRRYHLVREPMEELQSRFANSQEIKPPCTTFADGVTRTLRALLALDSSTQKTTVIFVRCATNVVDVAYQDDKKLLYVHEKWLHAPESHQGLPGPAKMHPGDFIGQHLVEDLYCRAVAIIWQQTKNMQSNHHLYQPADRLPQVLRLSRQRLHEMPRKIQVISAENKNTMAVSFYTGHSLFFIDFYSSPIFYLVVLHRAGCTAEMAQLVYDGSRDVCKCPRQAVPLSSRTAIFHNIGEGPWVPMIAKMPIASAGHYHPSSNLKAQDGALVGIPSQAALMSKGNAAGEELGPHVEERGADHSTPPAARAQATELTAAMSDIEMTPVASDGVSLARNAVETPSLGRYNGSSPSESFPLTTQHPAEWPTAPPLITVTANRGDNTLPDYPKKADCYADDVNSADDPAFAWSQAASLMESASAVSSERCEWEEQAEGNGPPACTVGVPNQGHVISTDAISRAEVKAPFQPCEDSPTTWKGQYVQATLTASEEVDSKSNPCVLYVHDVSTPTENDPSPQLVVTKYSFLTDHPALGPARTANQQHELILHFHDADRMGEKDDAQILDVNDVVAVNAFRAPGTVVHVSQTPDPVTGLFARYGVWDGSRLESLFVTPLRTGRDNLSCLTPLPVASVFNLSPEDISLSAGFSQAGYRIHAALGLNKIYHQLWKEQYPDTAVYPGSPASVIDDLDGGKLSLPDPGDSQTPRIITISSRRQADADHTDPTESLPACLEGLRNCSLAAQSPTLRANFIILTQPHYILHEQYQGHLANTTSLLLEEGYSVTLRTLSIGHSDLRDDMPVLLLAAPRDTNPQWIDDTLPDHQVTSSVVNEADRGASPIDIETPCSDHGDTLHISSDQWTQRSYVVARQSATVVSRIIGELSKENQNRDCSTTWAGCDEYWRRQDHSEPCRQGSSKKLKLSLPDPFAESNNHTK